MTTNELLSYLGLPGSAQELIKYMSALGVDLANEMRIEKDEYGNYDGYRSYIERPRNGYCLVFSDETEFLGKRDQPVGVGELYFSTVFFYSDGKDNYAEYKNDLPFGLSFNDTRQDVLAKLGTQSWQRLAKDGERVISDRWDSLPDVPYRLHVTYDSQTAKISILSASIPDKPL